MYKRCCTKEERDWRAPRGGKGLSRVLTTRGLTYEESERAAAGGRGAAPSCRRRPGGALLVPVEGRGAFWLRLFFRQLLESAIVRGEPLVERIVRLLNYSHPLAISVGHDI